MRHKPNAEPLFLELDPQARSERVKGWAREIGFDLAGVARAERLEEESRFLQKWLAQGFHSGMGWMARDPGRRIEPEQILAGCRSVVVVAANYHRGGSNESRSAGEAASPAPQGGRIAQYAQRIDYHRTLGKQVRRLARRIADAALTSQAEESVSRAYVDTGPVLEKAWAQRAGLGFIGKNTCLINKSRGSWFLLGVVFTTVELAPDQPIAEACGACRRCLNACPTGALVQPGVLDAGRCLSYLTIEHRGEEIPGDLASRFEGWLFGCDICQEVCPYNGKFQTPSSEEGILGRFIHPPSIPLRAILDLQSEEEFLARFGRQSPLRRPGLKGLRRTARVLGA